MTQLCSDAVELCGDAVVPLDSMSRDRVNSLPSCDARSVATQPKPDVITSTRTPEPPPPHRDMLSRSAEIIVTNTPNAAGVHSIVTSTIPSIVTPMLSHELVNSTAAAASRAPKISMSGQQRPKSLDQEFTLLNLDIPNVTIHGVRTVCCNDDEQIVTGLLH